MEGEQTRGQRSVLTKADGQHWEQGHRDTPVLVAEDSGKAEGCSDDSWLAGTGLGLFPRKDRRVDTRGPVCIQQDA